MMVGGYSSKNDMIKSDKHKTKKNSSEFNYKNTFSKKYM